MSAARASPLCSLSLSFVSNYLFTLIILQLILFDAVKFAICA